GVFVGALSVRGALLERGNLFVSVGQLHFNLLHVSVASLIRLELLFLVGQVAGRLAFLLLLLRNLVGGILLHISDLLLFSRRLIRRHRLGGSVFLRLALSVGHILLTLMNCLRRLLLFLLQFVESIRDIFPRRAFAAADRRDQGDRRERGKQSAPRICDGLH